jgi:hypothetical protein
LISPIISARTRARTPPAVFRSAPLFMGEVSHNREHCS